MNINEVKTIESKVAEPTTAESATTKGIAVAVTKENVEANNSDNNPNNNLESLKLEFFNRMKDKSPHTINEYRRSLERLCEFMQSQGLVDIQLLSQNDLKTFQEFLYKQRYYSTVTVSYFLENLSRACNFLIKQGLISNNPFKDVLFIPRPEPTQRSNRYYSHSEALRRYDNYLKAGFSFCLYKQYLEALRIFIHFLETKDIKSVCSVHKQDILEYVNYLWNYRSFSGRNYTVGTIQGKLVHLKSFYLFWYREGFIQENPAKEIGVSKLLEGLSPDTRPRYIVIEKNQTKFDKLYLEYKNYLMAKAYANESLRSYKTHLYLFFNWLENSLIKDITEVSKTTAFDYYKYLNSFKGIKQKGWSTQTRFRHLVVIRSFFKFLFKYDYIKSDPSVVMELPKSERGLPTTCILDQEARRLLNTANSQDAHFKLRDKAILELLYSSAIRISELCHLDIGDIDLHNDYVRVRFAKGGRSYERVVPFGKFTHLALMDYINNLRPQLDKKSHPALFLSYRGNRIGPYNVREMVHNYTRQSGIKKNITPHSFRVGCATELLRNGADIRYVQEQLGHKSLETTKLYTRLIPKDLKKIHTLHHPREKLYRSAYGQKVGAESVVFS